MLPYFTIPGLDSSYAYDAAGNQTLAAAGLNSSAAVTTVSKCGGDLTRQIDSKGNTSDYRYGKEIVPRTLLILLRS